MSTPVPVAGSLESFFTDRLMRERRASPHTIAAYRDTFRLLLGFVQARLKKAPSAVTFADLDAPLIGAFLDDLERARGNSARTRGLTSGVHYKINKASLPVETLPERTMHEHRKFVKLTDDAIHGSPSSAS